MYKLTVLIFIFLQLSLINVEASESCQIIFNQNKNPKELMKILVHEDLGEIQKNEAKNLSAQKISELNQEALMDLENLQSSEFKPKAMTYSEASNLIKKIRLHSVVGNDSKYERKETSIGYCFGRATYVHLEALRLGYSKDQIRKVWVVGPMQNGILWDFHVATAIRNANKEWFVIDTVTGEPLSPENWYKTFLKMSTDKKLRFFVTNPNKFTKAPGGYTRIQMGLNLDKDSDWYQHYFKDLMSSMSH